MTNRHNTVLYTSVTSDLVRRAFQHGTKELPGFTSRYNADKLVYFESTNDATAAIMHDKQIKAGSRARKVALINASNPDWHDLYDDLV